MINIVTLAAYTYRQLVSALDKDGSFTRLIDPKSPWVVPSNCNSDTLQRRLLQFQSMLDSVIEPQERAALQSQLFIEICNMKHELNDAEDKQNSANQQVAQIDASWKIDSLVREREPIAKIDLNAMFRCRQLFSSMVNQSSELSAEDQVLLKQALKETYRAIEFSGLNDILVAAQSYLDQFFDAGTQTAGVSADARKSKEERVFWKDWGVTDFTKCRAMALAEGGLRVTGAIITLALVIHDRDVARGTAFALVWNPFVEMLVGGKLIRDACNPRTSPENQDVQGGEPEPPITPVLKS